MAKPGNQPTHSSGLIQALLACVGPLIVLGLAAYWFAQPPEASVSESAAQFEAKLEKDQPEVVLLGNSMARLGVDAKQLSERIDAKVTNLSIDGSSASVWYLILKNRVFAQGHNPHAVIVFGAARTFMSPTPAVGLETTNASAHRVPVETVFDAKVSGQGGLPLEWLWAKWRRDLVRNDILDSIRSRTTGVLFKAEIDAANVDADTWAKTQLETVFDSEKMRDGQNQTRVIPVVDSRSNDVAINASTFDDSFLPALVQLAEEHSTRILFVRMPIAPSGPSGKIQEGTIDGPFEALMADALDWLSEQDAGFVDLRNMGLMDTDFIDYLHVNKTGRTKLTQQLGTHLNEIGLMGTDPLPRVINLDAAPLVRRGGIPDIPTLKNENATLKTAPCIWQVPFTDHMALSVGPLSKLGIEKASPLVVLAGTELLSQKTKIQELNAEECTPGVFMGRRVMMLATEANGDLPTDLSVELSADFPHTGIDGSVYHWVFPGQTVTTQFPEAWPEAAGDFRVYVSGIQTANGSPLTVRINGGPATPVEPMGARLESEWKPEAPTGEWNVELTVPEDGSPTLIQSLAVGEGFSATWLIGAPNQHVTRRAIGGVRKTIRFAADPPPIEGVTLSTVDNGLIRFDASSVTTLNDIDSWRASTFWSCSPVKVTLDGKPIGKGHQKCKDLPSLPPGSYCHVGNEVLLKPLADMDPTKEPDRWAIVIDPKRGCGTQQWLLPGDVMSANPWKPDTAAMPAGIRSISIQGRVIEHPKKDERIPNRGPEETLLDMKVMVGDTPLIATAISRSQLNGETIQFAIDPPVVPGDDRVDFVISSRTDGPYVVLSSASVSEARIEESAPEVTP